MRYNLINKTYKKITSKNKVIIRRLTNNFHFRSYHGIHNKFILRKSLKIIISEKINEPRTAEFIIDAINLLNGNIYHINELLYLHNVTTTNSKIHPINSIYRNRQIWYEFFQNYYERRIWLKIKLLYPSKIKKKDFSIIFKKFKFYNSRVFENQEDTNKLKYLKNKIISFLRKNKFFYKLSLILRNSYHTNSERLVFLKKII